MISTTWKTAGLPHQEGEGGEQNKEQLHQVCSGGLEQKKSLNSPFRTIKILQFITSVQT